MQEIWSEDRKYQTWRRLWLALAEGQKELGLSITQVQIDGIKNHLDDINYKAVAKYEKDLRHDVMAHLHALGDLSPESRPILHLGATSQFLNCNTELIQLKDALSLILEKVKTVIILLGERANEWKSIPVIGWTHYQTAQPTTAGKRAACWAYDYALIIESIEHRINTLRFRGIRGATGTQASFLALFNGNHEKIEQLDKFVTKSMGWNIEKRLSVTGQTYPRVIDALILGDIAAAGAVLHKFATDIRLLSNLGEVQEPFGKKQIGSSAMPYKRNPMRSERICALSRFVMNIAPNSLQTAATQWLERSLDDSANRRLTLPEAFLALDGALDLAINISEGMLLNKAIATKRLEDELPFFASENLMMAATSLGHDRQEVHEIIRTASMKAKESLALGGEKNNLLKMLKSSPLFKNVDFDSITDPNRYIGLAPKQVEKFISEIVNPLKNEQKIIKTSKEPIV